MSKTVTIIPAQPGFARVDPWWRHKSPISADSFGYNPIVAWRIIYDEERDKGDVLGICADGRVADSLLLRPDGAIVCLQPTTGRSFFQNAEALADEIRKREEATDEARRKAAEVAGSAEPPITTPSVST